MKIYVNNPKESWVVDRFRKEWYSNNKALSTKIIGTSDVIWIIAPWTWRKIPIKQLQNKRVICTIHHIDEQKFNTKEKNDFYDRDLIVDEYHTISNSTFKQLNQLTDKKIHVIPFWINTKIWKELDNKNDIKKKLGINQNDFVIGSFQRDTEGSDLISPKLSKGPDQFLKVVKHINTERNNLVVLLSGKRRQYIINKLEENNINYRYFEMVDFDTLNEFYNILDLYIVASRVEGGPASLMECAILKIPIISTDVGIASEVLNKNSIFNMNNYKMATPNVNEAYTNAAPFCLPNGLNKFIQMFENLYEN
jgi:glycosyltransferase involved in cell wall biosynthesis